MTRITPVPSRVLADRSLSCFAVAAPGLESLVADELRGLQAFHPLELADPEPGGIGFHTGRRGLYAANLHLRIASRVLVRVGTFHAAAFHELERHAARLPWTEFIAPGRPVAFRVTSKKSRLYHQDAVAERLVAAAGAPAAGPAETPQEFVVRLFRDECTVSADASGELLHRRGYRQAVARAPLRETIAAAMLLAVGWDGSTPLVDPFCGSGTIPIEGALLARRIAPGLVRADRSSGFAFQSWPELDARAWREEVDAARAEVRPGAEVPIVGSDRDAGAVAAARENATRAGVAADATFERRALSDAAPPDGAGVGMLVTNPPYGVRVGDQAAVRDLWARFGQVVHERFGGWTAALLSPDPALDRQTRLRLAERFRTRNGGIPVRLVAGSP